MTTIRRALLGYVGYALIPMVIMSLLMAFVPTPYQARSPDCVGSSPAPGIRLDCDDDALVVEMYEYAIIAYIGVITAGFIVWCAAIKSRVTQYTVFMLSFLGFGAAALH